MNLAHFGARARRLAGLFAAGGVTGLFAQRVPHFLARGLPHPLVMPVRLAGALGLAGACLLINAIRPPLFIAGARRGAGRLAQPRRSAKQIGLDLAFDIAVAAATTAAMTALALPIGLRFVIARVARAAVLTAAQAARGIV